jgi:hypothetical protein
VPLDWAATQNDLGGALLMLEGLQSETGRLAEAVVAFHEALKEWTRERVRHIIATKSATIGSFIRDACSYHSISRVELRIVCFTLACKRSLADTRTVVNRV